METFTGTGAAIVTPFNENRDIDFDGLANLLDHTSPVDYWVVCGTTAESATLSFEEKQQILDFVKANNPSQKPIMFGIGGNNTHQVVNELSAFDLSGVDAILSVCPYYVKPTQKGIVAHYNAVADASPVPVLLYNVPSRTGVNMLPETVVELSAHNNIFGIKDATGDLLQAMKVINNTPEEFMLVSGEDMLTIPLISVGAKGVISVIANVLPQEYSSVVSAALAGEFPRASKEMAPLLSFNEALFEEGNPVSVKTALSVAGKCEAYVRLPLVEGSELLRNKLQSMLASIKLESRKQVFFSDFDARTAI